MPTLSKYLLQRFARGMEDVMRQSAWELGTRSGVTSRLPDLEAIIRDAYTRGFPAPAPTPGVDIATTPLGRLVQMLRAQGVEPPKVVTSVDFRGNPVVEPNWQMLEAIKAGALQPQNGAARVWADELFKLANPVQGPAPEPNMPLDDFLSSVRATEGMFSPANLEDALVNLAGIGDPAVAAQAAKAWQDIIQAASIEGVGLSNTIHFDYANLNNLEALVRQLVPFSTWSMKAFPFFARQIAEHPILLTSALELNRQSENMRAERGLTARVQGALPYGEALDAFWGNLLGRPVDTYFNPLRGLVPFSDTQKSLESAEDMTNPVAAAYKLLTAFGPSAHPALEFVARTAGILGTDTPARGLLRLGGPAQGVTSALGVNRGRGVNPEDALLAGEEHLREALSGREVTDLAVTAAERRIDELALKTTGQPITSGHPAVVPYLQAKAEHRGQLWDQAMRDVARERGARSLVGYVSNQLAPQAIVSREEARIRGARATLLVPQDLATQVRDLKARDQMARVPDSLVGQVREIVTRLPGDSGIRPEDIQVVLDRPVAANVDWLFRAIYEYEREKSPDVSAYSGAGTPEQRELQALLGQYRNLAASVPELAGLPPEDLQAIQALVASYRDLPAGLQPRNTVAGRYASLIGQSQQKFRAANPLLDEYLSWLAGQRGQGTVEDFIALRAGR